jgi:hypothetical protein
MVNTEEVKLEEGCEKVKTKLNGRCKLLENSSSLIGFGKSKGNVSLERARKGQIGD